MKKITSKKTGLKSNHTRRPFNKTRQKTVLLEFFFEHPGKKYTVRSLEKQTKISRSTVQYYLKDFKEKGLISIDNKWFDNPHNKLIKQQYFVRKISESGLLDYLEKELGASSIILFGSFAKGESIKESDIDLFVECARDKELNLKKFEKKIGHNIEIFMKRKITQLPSKLLNNVVNGIKLRGYFTIK